MLTFVNIKCHRLIVAASKPYHHGSLRSALVEASLALISAEGIPALTLREVARRAGVSHAAPYRHFADKADLLAAIAADGFGRLTVAVESAARCRADPLDRIRAAAVAYAEFGLDRPAQFEVMFSPALAPESHAGAQAAAQACFDALLSLIVDARQAGLIVDYGARTAARIAWAHVHGVTELALRAQFSFRTRDEIVVFAQEAAGALLSGIAPARSASFPSLSYRLRHREIPAHRKKRRSLP
jgi:AcrR family transcriptional regulator